MSNSTALGLRSTGQKAFLSLGFVLSLLLATLLVHPGTARAVTPLPDYSAYAQDTSLFMSGPGLTLTILSGSEADSLSVTATTFTLTLSATQSATVRYPGPNPGTLPNDGGLPSCNNVGGNNDLVVNGPMTVTVTPNTTLCGVSGGGGAQPLSVTLGQPNGGETLTGGSTAMIFWSSSGSEPHSVRIHLSTDGGNTYPTLVAANEIDDGVYSWAVPDVSTANAKLRVQLVAAGDVVRSFDASDASFRISRSAGTSGGGGGGGGGGGEASSGQGTTSVEGSDSSSSGKGAMARADADAHLPPAFQTDSLVKLPDDHDAKTEADTVVYYIGLDAKRHPFINRAAFLSWYSGFGGVRDIDSQTLASIPLGAPVLVRPGTHWVKIVSDPRTYYVEPGYKLRWIKDEAAAVTLGGSEWNKNIIDVDPAFFTLFSYGPDIDAAYLATAWPSGSLLDSTVLKIEDRNLLGLRYYTSGGKKRVLNSDSAFDANRFQSRFVWHYGTDLGNAALQAMPAGTDISGPEDGLFSLLH